MGRKRKNRASKPHFLGKLLALLPVCTLLYPLYLAAQLDLVEEDYVSPYLPKAFDGLRLAFISDIHYGAFLKEERVHALAAQINALAPDIIVLGGDYGEDSAGAVRFFEQVRPDFQAGYCVVGVMGNHDRTVPESNLNRIRSAMEKNGVIPLVNDVWMLEKAGKRLALAGVDDVFNGHPDIAGTARLCRDADFTIFIPHNPDALPMAYDLQQPPFFQLALCGHTHGGQVAILGHSLHSSADTGDRYRSGWYHERGADILVSNGVGTSGLPVRLGARPQIHLLRMKTAQK